jgi:hypothetical protein
VFEAAATATALALAAPELVEERLVIAVVAGAVVVQTIPPLVTVVNSAPLTLVLRLATLALAELSAASHADTVVTTLSGGSTGPVEASAS